MRIKFFLLLLVLALVCSGCTFVGDQTKPTGTDKQPKTNDSAGGGTVNVADPVPGQSNNPVLSPDDHGGNIDGIKNALGVLIDGLVLNDLKNVSSCLHGLDEGNSPIAMEELQREMAQLHPVHWSVISYRPVGEQGALVALSYTLPDGTVRETASFDMQNAGTLWTVHYNSFADSFHNMARHVIKKADALVAN